jgi:hypothetical protein
MLNSAVSSVQHQFILKVAHIQEHVLPLHDLTMLNSGVSSVLVTDHFKVAHIKEHVLPLHDLTMLLSQVMKRTSRVIEECWHESPDARLTALRVQKTLTKVEELLTDESSIQVCWLVHNFATVLRNFLFPLVNNSRA